MEPPVNMLPFGGLLLKMEVMIRRTAHKHRQDADFEIKQNLEYWLSRPPRERLAAVDLLRRQMYGDTGRIQKVVRIVHRSQG